MFNPFSSSVLLKPDSVKNQAKEILEHFCSRDGSGNYTEVRLLIDEHPSLLNVVIIASFELIHLFESMSMIWCRNWIIMVQRR